MVNIRISDSEWIVMECLWDHSPLTAADIIDRLSGKTGWKPSTIKTLLSRLVEKGALSRDPGDEVNVYRPLVTRDEAVSSEKKTFLDRVFSGSAKMLVASFVESGELDEETIVELKSLIEKKIP